MSNFKLQQEPRPQKEKTVKEVDARIALATTPTSGTRTPLGENTGSSNSMAATPTSRFTPSATPLRDREINARFALLQSDKVENFLLDLVDDKKFREEHKLTLEGGPYNTFKKQTIRYMKL